MAPCLSLYTLTADGLLSFETGKKKDRKRVTLLHWRSVRYDFAMGMLTSLMTQVVFPSLPFFVMWSFLSLFGRVFSLSLLEELHSCICNRKGQGKLNGITWHFWGSMSIMSLGRYRLNYARTNNFVHMHTTNIFIWKYIVFFVPRKVLFEILNSLEPLVKCGFYVLEDVPFG